MLFLCIQTMLLRIVFVDVFFLLFSISLLCVYVCCIRCDATLKKHNGNNNKMLCVVSSFVFVVRCYTIFFFFYLVVVVHNYNLSQSCWLPCVYLYLRFLPVIPSKRRFYFSLTCLFSLLVSFSSVFRILLL